MKRRLDEEIVKRGLLESRTLAKTFILEGKVLVNARKAIKPSELVNDSDNIEIIEEKKYVSRGGFKLEFALEQFGVDVSDKVCIDIGSSTGGFTDCLLKHGAKKVYAVDVGKNLLDPTLKQNPKVVLIEEFNARFLSKEIINEPVDFITIDVSFISIIKILPNLLSILKDEGEIVSLIKPQFEGEPKYLKKGIVKEKSIHITILKELLKKVESIGFTVQNITYSPIRGGKGNIEFFFHIKKKGIFVKEEIIDKIVEEAWEKTT
ncbi:TlyA family RNA methyltransferase [Caldisericum exile]|uniref:Hemolysin n=1 Tax=Caldisericum exile (strain DSM 21853 / NBRC 104410 / AZM16c01) TaxID=511051 RepID=A0A7U6JG21_CALEA|nr:TlyA family RNA methyltransferase [Caldisericum exile]BAL80915.1 putative hemolysin [Caldisericum exile AZM16c01]